ncbi:hypothetical protein [Anaerococcus ihuae]|uniref:hypothetical protein n=1 Tax=Anaerococcus ihuae TaxID=2899519 RepID=UPI001F1A195E|nr:hypothetical protein [Anaerococcus ihuae]
MKKRLKNKNYLIGLIMFIMTLIFSYFAYKGVFFLHKQEEIFKMYENPLIPLGSSFYIWIFIYIFSSIFLLLPFIKKLSMTNEEIYYEKLMPLFIFWNMANGIYCVMINNNYPMPGLIGIMAYALILITLVKTIDQNKDFSKKYKLLVTLPTGIHGGWIIFSVFPNIMIVFSQSKSLDNKTFVLVISLILLILASAMVLFVFKENKNPGLIIGFLWGILGIIIRQSPKSNFSNANIFIFIGASILFILVSLISIYILKFIKEK